MANKTDLKITGIIKDLPHNSSFNPDFILPWAFYASANSSVKNPDWNNFSFITLFVLKGKIIWAVASPMAICNVTGSWLGARLAISKGNGFIRVFFLIVVGLALIRFGYDVFLK